jgi:hypothetical protein
MTTAMGSPVSPIVANLYMEKFEAQAMATAPRPPSIWFRYVDDTFVLIHEYDIDGFTAHINGIDANIKFTNEPEEDGKLPFLDTCIHVNDDGSTKVTIYRKPTHTDQYLNFKSNHHIEHNRSVVRSLMDRVDKLVTTDEDKDRECEHVKSALIANGYKQWMFKIPKRKQRTSDQDSGSTRKVCVGLPYTKGLSKNLINIFRNHGVHAYHKPVNTIRSFLVHPKDKTPDSKKCGSVYKVSCPKCTDTYIGETIRTLDTRIGEHRKTKGQDITAVGEHTMNTKHTITVDNVKIIAREEHLWKRKIREAVEIKTHAPTLNRDTGYDLPAIFDKLLSRDHPKKVVM